MNSLWVDERDPATVPGGLFEYVRREVSWGVIEFERAPVGYLKKDGTPRLMDWRAYMVTPNDQKRTRYPSMTTLLGAILPKDLSRYGETHGAIGAHFLHQQGDLTTEHTDEDAVEMVRERRVGVEAATNRAASRGIDVHKFLEEFGKTGEMPRMDVPPELAGYVKGLEDFLKEYDPEPSATELLVADPDRGFAGRLDMRARTRTKSLPFRAHRIVDLKTSPKLSIWPSAHAQTQGYRLADMKCGGPETDTPIVVVVDAEGRFEVADCLCSEEQLDAGLGWYRALKPIESACSSRHYQRRKAA